MNYKYISLGGNCSVAFQLNKLKLRKKSYPFDWAKISLNQLLRVLENNFEEFEDVKLIKTLNNNKLLNSKSNNNLLKNKYNIHFANEVLFKYNIEEFKIILQKRVDRFKTIAEPIVFFRLEKSLLSKNNINKYKYLLTLLESYFKEFKLVVILNENSEVFQNDKIKWVTFKDFSNDWTYSHLDWSNIIHCP